MKEHLSDYEIEVATPEDIPELLKLQAENQISRGGALSIEFPASWFADVIREMPIVIARRKGRVVGFLVSSTQIATKEFPLSQAKFRAYPVASSAYNSGPLCIATTERGNGLVSKLFDMQASLLPGREGVAFIRLDNVASRAVHAKGGFSEVAEFTYGGIGYLVAARKNTLATS